MASRISWISSRLKRFFKITSSGRPSGPPGPPAGPPAGGAPGGKEGHGNRFEPLRRGNSWHWKTWDVPEYSTRLLDGLGSVFWTELIQSYQVDPKKAILSWH